MSRLYALVSYAEGDDPKEVTERYLTSADLAEDMKGFDVSDIIGAESLFLTPSNGSPLE